MSESTTTATTLQEIWDEAVEAANDLWVLFIDDLEDRAYEVSDPIWPEHIYMGSNRA